MKVFHVEARIKSKIVLPEDFIKSLPKTVVLFTTIQLIGSMDTITKQIEDSGREVLVFKTGHTRHKGQILGCNVQTHDKYTDKEFDAFVYVGDGLFHPKALVMKNNDKVVHVFNPFTEEKFVVDSTYVDRLKKKQTASMSKFYMSTNIGVLVSLKPGQFFMKKAFELRDEYPDKNFYYVLDNTIDFGGLEDFPFVDVWINTACPRIGFDDSIKLSKPVVNLEDVKKNSPNRARIL